MMPEPPTESKTPYAAIDEWSCPFCDEVGVMRTYLEPDEACPKCGAKLVVKAMRQG